MTNNFVLRNIKEPKELQKLNCLTLYVKEKHGLLQEFVVSYYPVIVSLIFSVSGVRFVISLATSFLS